MEKSFQAVEKCFQCNGKTSVNCYYLCVKKRQPRKRLHARLQDN